MRHVHGRETCPQGVPVMEAAEGDSAAGAAPAGDSLAADLLSLLDAGSFGGGGRQAETCTGGHNVIKSGWTKRR